MTERKTYNRWHRIPKTGRTPLICSILMVLEAYDEESSVRSKEVVRELEKRALPKLDSDLTSGLHETTVSSDLGQLSKMKGAIIKRVRIEFESKKDGKKKKYYKYWFSLPRRGYIPEHVTEQHLELVDLLENHPNWTPVDYDNYWKEKQRKKERAKVSTLGAMIEEVKNSK